MPASPCSSTCTSLPSAPQRVCCASSSTLHGMQHIGLDDSAFQVLTRHCVRSMPLSHVARVVKHCCCWLLSPLSALQPPLTRIPAPMHSNSTAERAAATPAKSKLYKMTTPEYSHFFPSPGGPRKPMGPLRPCRPGAPSSPFRPGVPGRE
jgi:hypothetical protein